MSCWWYNVKDILFCREHLIGQKCVQYSHQYFFFQRKLLILNIYLIHLGNDFIVFKAYIHKYTHIKEHKCTRAFMLTNMRTASPGPFLFSEPSVPARHTHSFLTHNFNWSHFLSNCNNQVIHSRLFPAYYSFSRLLSQSCAEAQEVIVF